MFGRISSNIVRILIKYRILSLIFLLGLIVLLIIGIRRLQIEEDLYSIFPDGKEYQEFSHILQKNNSKYLRYMFIIFHNYNLFHTISNDSLMTITKNTHHCLLAR